VGRYVGMKVGVWVGRYEVVLSPLFHRNLIGRKRRAPTI
jgi:hypothetical protein